MSRPVSLLLAALVALATLIASFGTTASAQTDPAGASRPDAASSWLADQFVDGERLQVTFGADSFDDQGLTIDALIAFATAGVAEGVASDATAWLGQSTTTGGYVGDGTVESYAGALAKLSLLAQIRGLDPTNWGADGVDLIARLEAQEQPSGRFTDTSDFGDFSNSIGQSLAIVALTRQPATSASDAAVDLLLLSQCADGGFDLALEPGAGSCTSGVDTSAYGLQALLAAGRAGDVDAIDDAITYLTGAQGAEGGFGTAVGEMPNANSTGLAVQALRVAGSEAPADDGVAFLAALQADCADETDRGAVAFDASGFDAGTSPRATAQAILGFTGIGYAEASSAGAAAGLPRFDCRVPSPSSSSTSTTSTTGPGSVLSGTQTPAAVPVVANPRFTG